MSKDIQTDEELEAQVKRILEAELTVSEVAAYATGNKGAITDIMRHQIMQLIKAHTQQAIDRARLEMVSSANCILQTDEPAIDEIWFDYEGFPMRQDTLTSHLQNQLNNLKGGVN